MMRQDRGIQNSLKKKLSDWRRDAMEQKKIVDLTKTLYVLQLVSAATGGLADDHDVLK